MRGLPVLLALPLTLAISPAASAQELAAGDRIRVTTVLPTLDRQPGVLLGFDTDTLSFHAQGSDWSLPLESISLLERSDGTRSHALVGALIGLGAGLLIPLAATGSDLGSSACQADTGGNLCGAVILVGGVSGGLLGLIVGALIRTDRWVPMEHPYR